MDWTQIGIAGVAALAGLILTALGIFDKLGTWFAAAWRWVRRRSTHHDAAVPPKTIIAIPEPRLNALWWSCAKQTDGRLIMQICCDLNVTNTWSQRIKIAGAVFRQRRRWFGFHRDVQGDTMVKDWGSQYHGHYELLPNVMTNSRTSFMYSVLQQPNPERDLIANVALIDQFGNHHWLRRLHLKHVEHITL